MVSDPYRSAVQMLVRSSEQTSWDAELLACYSLLCSPHLNLLVTVDVV